jgi:hypothetical protein
MCRKYILHGRTKLHKTLSCIFTHIVMKEEVNSSLIGSWVLSRCLINCRCYAASNNVFQRRRNHQYNILNAFYSWNSEKIHIQQNCPLPHQDYTQIQIPDHWAEATRQIQHERHKNCLTELQNLGPKCFVDFQVTFRVIFPVNFSL